MANVEFEVPNQYGYFPSVIEKAKMKREQNADGFDKDVYMSKAEQTECPQYRAVLGGLTET